MRMSCHRNFMGYHCTLNFGDLLGNGIAQYFGHCALVDIEDVRNDGFLDAGL